MPQISPMNWMMLNLITQSSIIQMISFKNNSKLCKKQNILNMSNNKMKWMW